MPMMEQRIHELVLVARRDAAGALHWPPGFESSPILAVAGVPMGGGVASERDIVSAAACLGWRVVRPCEDRPGACSLRLCRPQVVDRRTDDPASG